MNENTSEMAQSATRSVLEERSRVMFQESVAGIDMRVRSRLTQARHAALQQAAASGSRPWFLRLPIWAPAASVAAAALVGMALWVGGPAGTHGIADGQTNLEDLDIVASSDTASGDAIEMLQDDIDFYDFADKASSSGPAA